ncbi:hypothetical protein [Pseudarthrobacter chlorophenolicus]|uniref:hypothetical protein n=1 Tax=Pseudarthrobacter chlorophenolicus TaxID=85085 RepID=UPI000166882D|nr:hypothetical protein [Pseudarthrobacter chlorophenolicus]
MAELLVAAKDIQGTVTGTDKFACRLRDALEHGVQTQVFGQRDDSFDQAVYTLLRVDYFIRPAGKTGWKVPSSLPDRFTPHEEHLGR